MRTGNPIEWLGGLVVTVALAATAGCDRWSKSAEHEAEPPRGPVRVKVAAVREATFEELVRGIGTVTALPTHVVVIAPAVEGAVAEILVAEGDHVEAGQPIVKLDDRLAQRELAERRAARGELEAGLALLKTPPREAELRVAQREEEKAKTTRELAKAALDRLEPLYKRGDISVQQIQEARQRHHESELECQVCAAKLEVLKLPPKPEAVAEIQAKIDRAEAAVESADARLRYFTLASPRAGIVNSIAAHPGQHLAAGTVAAEVLDTSEVFATVWVPPRDAAKVHSGQSARVLIDNGAADEAPSEAEADEHEPLSGNVASVGRQAAPDTGTIPVRVRLDNRNGRLRLGMVATVEIVVGEVTGLAVPESAVHLSDEGHYVVIAHDGKAEIVHPRVGLRQHGLALVTDEDIEVGDLVVTHGGYALPDETELIIETEPVPHEDSEP